VLQDKSKRTHGTTCNTR